MPKVHPILDSAGIYASHKSSIHSYKPILCVHNAFCMCLSNATEANRLIRGAKHNAKVLCQQRTRMSHYWILLATQWMSTADRILSYIVVHASKIELQADMGWFTYRDNVVFISEGTNAKRLSGPNCWNVKKQLRVYENSY